jgi:hypothetical protein
MLGEKGLSPLVFRIILLAVLSVSSQQTVAQQEDTQATLTVTPSQLLYLAQNGSFGDIGQSITVKIPTLASFPAVALPNGFVLGSHEQPSKLLDLAQLTTRTAFTVEPGT